jgi:thiol-disulfide isomerase/thioredoxin
MLNRRHQIDSGEVVVIDFWATWCGPCKFISPIFEKLSALQEHQGIKFYKVDVDEQEEISQEVGIRAVRHSSFCWTEVIAVTVFPDANIRRLPEWEQGQ